MKASREFFTHRFTQANVALHRVLLQRPSAEVFWKVWEQEVVPLEQLGVDAADRSFRDHHIDWFYDLAAFSGFTPEQILGGHPQRVGAMTSSTKEPLYSAPPGTLREV